MTATAVTAGSTTTFTGAAGDTAAAETQVTTSAPTEAVSFSFEVERTPLTLKVGTATDGGDIVQSSVFAPGFHIVTFTPNASTYYVRFSLTGVGVALLKNFRRLVPGILEITSPYPAASVDKLRWAQSLNTMWFAGAGKEMHVFERRGQNSWSMRPFLQIDGPFTPLNGSDITLTPSVRTGETTITSSRALFATYDVGSLILVVHPGQFETANLSVVDDVTDPIEVSGIEASRVFQYQVTGTFVGTVVLERSIGNQVNYTTVLSASGVTSNIFDDDLDNQVIYYRWRMSAFTSGAAVVSLTYAGGVTEGVARVVAVTADNTVTADVIRPFGQTSASSLWALGEWSGRFGHPDVAALFDGRLWALRGNAYWGSGSDNFGSFATGPLASDAIGRTFGGNMASARWAVGASRLLVGLSGFESEIGSNSFDEVLKPENVRARNKSTKGSADTHAIHLDDAALFINRSKQRIYRFGYSNQTGDMGTIDLTRMHREIASTLGFVEMAWQQEPEPRLWCVRGDGEVGALVLDIDEGVVAWCRMKVDGFVESVCCLPTDNAEDEVYFVVRRTVGGVDVRHVEQLAPEAWNTVNQAWRLHDAVEFSNVSLTEDVEILSRAGDIILVRDGATVLLRALANVNVNQDGTGTLSGLWHLEGRTDVYAWADGQMIGPLTVTGGSVPVPFVPDYAIVGLKYSGRYKSGRLAWGAQMGAALVANKQLESLGLVIHRTAGGSLKWGTDFVDMERLDDRIDDGTLVFDAAVQTWSGDFQFNVHGWTERDTRLHIEMDTAGPATVLALVETMKVNG